jgi:hypothetical protein
MLSKEILKKNKIKLVPGDVLEVLLANGVKGYFQFIGKDDDYMAGHLIRAFEYFKPLSEITSPNVKEIVGSKIKFHSYTRVFEGIKDGLWTIIGNIPIEDNFEYPMFRQTSDVYSIVKKSYNWYIWKEDFNKAKKIGELTEEYKSLPVSSIYPPSAIVRWIETGWHGFMKPE